MPEEKGQIMTNEETVRNACQVIWSEGEVSRIGEFYAEDYQAQYPFGDGWGHGREGAKAFAEAIRIGFPDYSEEIEDLVVSGDKVAVRLRIRGTHNGPMFGIPASGKSVDFRDMTICKMKDGKIVEQCGLSDNLTLFVQLGVLQMPTAISAAE